ncbi:MAG: ArsR family transcriptional regulator [Fulvivirga sp.]|nr:ArsR family transcriptional regulator [Fulvivirga sp.]
MEFEEAKEEFIQAWGALGTSWGINKTMAQIFALLLISPGPLSVEQIMEELSISRGNVSMNLRLLMDWRLVEKLTKKGERKEYFHTDRDIWSIARIVAEERKNREIQPVLKVLNKIKSVDHGKSPEAAELNRVTSELSDIIHFTDTALTHYINSDKSWVSKTIMNLIKKSKNK